jgi:crotonobetaine/carnitine-CoA ligase
MRLTGTLLRSLGVRKGSVVAVQAHNTPQFMASLLGVIAAGALVSPLNPAFRGALLEHALKTNGAVILISELGSARHLVHSIRVLN